MYINCYKKLCEISQLNHQLWMCLSIFIFQVPATCNAFLFFLFLFRVLWSDNHCKTCWHALSFSHWARCMLRMDITCLLFLLIFSASQANTILLKSLKIHQHETQSVCKAFCMKFKFSCRWYYSNSLKAVPPFFPRFRKMKRKLLPRRHYKLPNPLLMLAGDESSCNCFASKNHKM